MGPKIPTAVTPPFGKSPEVTFACNKPGGLRATQTWARYSDMEHGFGGIFLDVAPRRSVGRTIIKEVVWLGVPGKDRLPLGWCLFMRWCGGKNPNIDVP